jgi:O-antigen/teichoic acid export membrane protein
MIDYKKYYNRIRNSKFFKDVSLVFIANLTSSGINFFSFLIIAKVLSNDDFGRLAVIMAIITGISDISNLGMNATTIRYTAIFKSKNETDNVNTLLSTVFTNILGISFLIVLSFFILSNFLTDILFKDSNYGSYLVLSSLGISVALLYSFFSAVFQGLQRFNSYLYFAIIGSILKIILVIIIYFANAFSLMNVFLIIAFTPLISILASKIWLRDHRISPFLYRRSMIKETYGFSKWIFLWSVFSIIQARVSTYLLASFTTMTEVSFFDMSKKFGNIIVFGLGSYLSVLNSRLACITDKAELQKNVNKSKLVTIVISAGLGVMVFVFPLILKLFFGTKYEGAIYPLGIVLFGLIFFVWSFPYNSGLYSLGKSKVFFYQALIALLVETGTAFILVPAYGAIGASITFVITNIVVLLLSVFYFKKYIREAQ